MGFIFKKMSVTEVINKKTGRKRKIYEKPEVALNPKKRKSPKSIPEPEQMELQEQLPHLAVI